MKRYRKQLLRILAGLLGILVTLAIAVRLVHVLKNRGAEPEPDSSQEDVIPVTDYTDITYDNGTVKLHFTRDGDCWSWADDPSFPLDGSYVDALLHTLSTLQAEKNITDTEALDTYGLSDPVMTVFAALSDGSARTVALGSTVPDGSGRYAILDGDTETVYVLSAELEQAISHPITEMMVLPTLPQIEERQLESILVAVGSGDTEKTHLLQATRSDSEDSSAVSTSWRMEGGDVSSVPAVRALISAVLTPAVERCVDYRPSAAAVELCGLKTPAGTVTVTYLDGAGAQQSWQLSVGNTTIEGGERYVRLAGDESIYAIPDAALQPLLTALGGALDG